MAVVEGSQMTKQGKTTATAHAGRMYTHSCAHCPPPTHGVRSFEPEGEVHLCVSLSFVCVTVAGDALSTGQQHADTEMAERRCLLPFLGWMNARSSSGTRAEATDEKNVKQTIKEHTHTHTQAHTRIDGRSKWGGREGFRSSNGQRERERGRRGVERCREIGRRAQAARAGSTEMSHAHTAQQRCKHLAVTRVRRSHLLNTSKAACSEKKRHHRRLTATHRYSPTLFH